VASSAGVYFMACALIHWLEKENRERGGQKKERPTRPSPSRKEAFSLSRLFAFRM